MVRVPVAKILRHAQDGLNDRDPGSVVCACHNRRLTGGRAAVAADFAQQKAFADQVRADRFSAGSADCRGGLAHGVGDGFQRH